MMFKGLNPRWSHFHDGFKGFNPGVLVSMMVLRVSILGWFHFHDGVNVRLRCFEVNIKMPSGLL